MHIVIKLTEEIISYYIINAQHKGGLCVQRVSISLISFSTGAQIVLQNRVTQRHGRRGGWEGSRITVLSPKSFHSSSSSSHYYRHHLRLLNMMYLGLGYTIVRWWHTVCDRLHIVDQGRALLAALIRNGQIRSRRSVGAPCSALFSGRGRRCRCCRPHFRK